MNDDEKPRIAGLFVCVASGGAAVAGLEPVEHVVRDARDRSEIHFRDASFKIDPRGCLVDVRAYAASPVTKFRAVDVGQAAVS
jgi:hypothetical protein